MNVGSSSVTVGDFFIFTIKVSLVEKVTHNNV